MPAVSCAVRHVSQHDITYPEPPCIAPRPSPCTESAERGGLLIPPRAAWACRTTSDKWPLSSSIPRISRDVMLAPFTALDRDLSPSSLKVSVFSWGPCSSSHLVLLCGVSRSRSSGWVGGVGGWGGGGGRRRKREARLLRFSRLESPSNKPIPFQYVLPNRAGGRVVEGPVTEKRLT